MKVQMISTTRAKLNNLSIVNGQLIYLSDESMAYYDMGGTRNTVTGIRQVSSLPQTGYPSILYVNTGSQPAACYIWDPTSSDFILVGGGSVGVTGVKGDAETDYRTGEVNITPANIGLGNVGNFKAVSTEANQGLTSTEQTNAKTNIGLENVGNFKAVSTVANQGLTDTEKANARANIGAGSGSVTSVATGVGLAGGPVSESGTIKANLKSETASALTAASKGSTADREYAVGVDANGNLSVNVPWVAGSTYANLPAASGGTSVSLVTTGDKYTWNNKGDGTVTSVDAGIGLLIDDSEDPITGEGVIKANLKSEFMSFLEASEKTAVEGREYAVGVDANGNLSVNIPWVAGSTSAGHTIVNAAGTTFTQRDKLKIENGNVVDDSANNQTIIKEYTYYGTKAAWDLMSDSEKAQYKYYQFTDDFDGMTFDNVPTEGSNNPVKSNGIYTSIQTKLTKPEIKTKTLAAGSTSVTFTNVPTTGDHIIDVYTNKAGLYYTAIDDSIAGSLTVTYEAQSSAVTVCLRIEDY